MVSHEAWGKVYDQVKRSIELGDELIAGTIPEEKGLSKPLLIEIKDKESLMLREELFGFVIAVMPY